MVCRLKETFPRLPYKSSSFKLHHDEKREQLCEETPADLNSLVSSCKFGIEYKTFRCVIPCEKCQFLRDIIVGKVCRRQTFLKNGSILKLVTFEGTVLTL